MDKSMKRCIIVDKMDASSKQVTRVIRAFFFSVDGDPHEPVRFSVRHFIFVRQEFDAYGL
jgi:hypothetical protein